jgi:BMFP domain-containing protein YqiC
MPIRLSKPALAALGLLKIITGGSPASGAESSERNGMPDLDTLVETGEELYDSMLLRAKERRDRIEQDIKTGLAGVLSELGLATREEIRNLRDSMSQTSADDDTRHEDSSQNKDVTS